MTTPAMPTAEGWGRATCAGCGCEYAIPTERHRRVIRAGRLAYCTPQCRDAAQRRRDAVRLADRFELGPCPGCGKMFLSRRANKRYCSMACYYQSPSLLQRLRAHNATKQFPPQACPQCGKVAHRRHRQFCNKQCYRQFFAERFDRWVANPEQLALPQCYDEFLMQAELPCLIAGCTWRGKHLAQHVNMVHGVPVAELRRLAGFNMKTGLCTPDISQKRSAVATDLWVRGVVPLIPFPPGGPGTCVPAASRQRRAEGREHGQKSRVVLAAAGPLRPPRACRQCGAAVIQPVCGRKLYCNPTCRAAWSKANDAQRAELQCSHCQRTFMGNAEQARRAVAGRPVCCSADCRNLRNMAICLADAATRRQQRTGSR